MAKRSAKTFTAETVGLKNNPNQHIPLIHTEAMEYESLAKLKYDVVQDKVVTLDHSKAVEYVDLPIFKGEREVGDAHVQTLYDEMRKGTFNSMLVILSTALYQGVTYKINGQHTCWAVLYMIEEKSDFSMQVREIKYKVNSEDQLKLLYASYDRIKARSDSHISKIFLIGTQAADGLSTAIINKLVSGFRFWHVDQEIARRRITPEQLAAVIQREYCELFKRIGDYIQSNNGHDISHRQPVIASMFATFDKVPTKAAEFWQPVIDGIGLTSKTDPRYVLRTDLLNVATGVSRKVGPKKEKRLMSAEDIFRICVSAWNKWRKDETCQAALRPTNTRLKPI